MGELLALLSKDVSHHHSPGQADSRSACSRGMMLPPSPHLLPITGFRRNRTLHCNPNGNYFCVVIFVTAKPKKLWQHCHRPQEILKVTNKVFLFSSVLAVRKTKKSSLAKPYPLALLKAWALGFNDLVFWRRGSFYQSFSEKGINLSI